ncbi:PhoH family protein [Candidatus Macondimonas diazotrophica]|nr:PhoH family protein [Candidatus Macondimonas diazotrophica]
MHDPTALFRFEEHGVFIPMVVLEELDAAKKGTSEVARNVRQVSRFLDELMQSADRHAVVAGLPLVRTASSDAPQRDCGGRLYFQTEPLPTSTIPVTLPGLKPDNTLLATVMALQSQHPDREVVLVSKDINLRIKASIMGLCAEDYFNDQVLDDADLLYRGWEELPEDFWNTHSKDMASWNEKGRTFYRVIGPKVGSWTPNLCLYTPDGGFEGIVREVAQGAARIEILRNYRENAIWGVHARNREQSFALNLLMDPDIDFVTLLGGAGTGKTLLALAAGLAQCLEMNRYREILMTRVTIPVGEDIGFLPGTEEEKMTPWMGALMDNLEVLTHSDEGGDWGRAATQDLLAHRIKIRSLNFMRGRTFLNRYLIIDEAQNLTAKQMKTLITRAGPGTKIVCLGNVAQIDTPYLTETSSGLTHVVDRFRTWSHGGHITLVRGERSRLADHAAEIL